MRRTTLFYSTLPMPTSTWLIGKEQSLQNVKTPTQYLRYLDDICGICTHLEKDFQTFLNTLNRHHSLRKIERKTHINEIQFLNTVSSKNPNFL